MWGPHSLWHTRHDNEKDILQCQTNAFFALSSIAYVPLQCNKVTTQEAQEHGVFEHLAPDMSLPCAFRTASVHAYFCKMRYSRLLASSRAHGLVFRPLPFKAFAPCTGASSSVAKPRNDFHLEFCAQGMGRAAAAPNVRRYTALSAAPVVDAPTSTSQNTDVR